jgi:RNA polymerase sigma factor (sigma-70 family)
VSILRPKTTTVLLEALRAETDPQVWGEFVARYQPLLVGFGIRLGLSEADATDAAQWTLAEFLKAFRAGRYERERGRLGSWIIGIAKHQVESLRREGARRAGWRGESGIVDLGNNDSLAEIWEQERRREILNAALCRLRSSARLADTSVRAFELVAIRGVSPEDAARECDLTVDEVYVARHRVTRKLRELVAEITAAYEENPA